MKRAAQLNRKGYIMRRKASQLAAALLFLSGFLWGLDTEPRHTAAAYSSMESILKNPETISFFVEGEDKCGSLTSSCDMHAIFPIGAKSLYSILLDPEKTLKVFTDTKSIQNVSFNGGDPCRVLQRQVIEISALGITKTYDYLLDLKTEVSKDGKEFKSSWNLVDSPDGTFSAVSGSWYFKELEYKGKPCTYVRNFTVNVMAKPFSGQKLILKLFAEGRIKKTLEDLYKAAAR